ncbi:MAG: Pycsar system effector family protein [Neoaquamicrobium sediminum]|uniref:Pycsar system effector family protein n=1 Tax=Neoaquamicrobium sediminum TaxID=1849104 RepID=UPI0040377AD1
MDSVDAGSDTALPELLSETSEIGRQYFYLDHLKKMNDVFYDQVKTANQKAAYLFTFMLAFLISSAEGRGVFDIDRYIGEDLLGMLLSGVMAIAVVFTLICAIMVVLPRKIGQGTSLFWGTWPQRRQAFLDANNSGDPDYLLNEYLGNVDNLSLLARAKFGFVTLAFRGLVITVVCYVLLLTFAPNG